MQSLKKIAEFFKVLPPHKALLLQWCAQISYIAVATKAFALDRSLWLLVITVAAAYATEFFCQIVERRFFPASTPQKLLWIPFSVFAIANSVFILLEAYGPMFYVAGAVASIALKFILKYNGRHVFNPTAIGVFAVAVLWPYSASLSADAWASKNWLVAMMLAFGLTVSFTAKRLVLALSYQAIFVMSSLLFLQYAKLYSGMNDPKFIPALLPLGVLVSVPNLLFAYHVITDPRTSPSTARGQFFFGASIALMDAAMRFFTVLNAPILAYLLVSLFVNALYPMLQEIGEKRVTA